MSLLDHLNQRSQSVKENYDFSMGMNKLFSSEFQGIRDIPKLPIAVEESAWETYSDFNKTYLKRTFIFDFHKHLRFFVNEILKMSNEMNHHPTLLIDSSSVIIELFTHDINDVSESDFKMSNFIDEIYDDVRFIQEF